MCDDLYLAKFARENWREKAYKALIANPPKKEDLEYIINRTSNPMKIERRREDGKRNTI